MAKLISGGSFDSEGQRFNPDCDQENEGVNWKFIHDFRKRVASNDFRKRVTSNEIQISMRVENVVADNECLTGLIVNNQIHSTPESAKCGCW